MRPSVSSRSIVSRGQRGPDTQSPRLMVASTPRRPLSASTASSARRLPWISARTASCIDRPWSHLPRARQSSSAVHSDGRGPCPHALCPSRVRRSRPYVVRVNRGGGAEKKVASAPRARDRGGLEHHL